MALYNIAVLVSKQEAGLYRAEWPELQGCFTDNATLEGALRDIQDAIQVWLIAQKEMGWKLPKTIQDCDGFPVEARIPAELP